MSNIYLKVSLETFSKLQFSGFKILKIFNFERNYVLKSKNPCILLNKNINFNKNETESKMENLTYCLRKTNLGASAYI